MGLTRRDFLKGCCASALASGMPASLAWFDPAALKAMPGHPIVIVVFLRGGLDGLHFMPPWQGDDRVHYENRRGSLAIPQGQLLRLGSSDWSLHPRAAELHARFAQGRMALVHACGMPTFPTRSHFDAQASMEYGTPGLTGGSSGWLARYLAAESNLPAPLLGHAIGLSGTTPTSLIGADETLTTASAEEFRVDGFHWSWNNSDASVSGHAGAHLRLLPLWNGNGPFDAAGRRAAEALLYMREIDFRLYHASNAPTGYQPEGGAAYPTSGDGADLARQLRHLAQLIKLDLGLAAATLDYGGWDTHDSQGMPGAGYDYFGNRVEGFSRALDAFLRDLAGHSAGDLTQRVTVVVHSEFGRRFTPNASSGTDHGYGNLMMAFGGGVQGGLHGSFPGLADDQLFEGQDVDVTTDYRQVLAEALVKRQGLSAGALSSVFPSLAAVGGYQPRGVFTAA